MDTLGTADTSGATSLTAADIEKMKALDLKYKLGFRGLPVSGLKPALVERLKEAVGLMVA